MRLALGTFPVHDVVFGSRTTWNDGVLTIDRGQLIDRIRRDNRILEADLELARPGESLRIVNVRDVLEPRVKVQGSGSVYPGICGRPIETVGTGVTHCLSGVTIVESANVVFYEGNDGWLDRFIDMSGPGASAAPWGSLLNLCLILNVTNEISVEEQNHAAHGAALDLSDTLARVTAELTPPEKQVFELTPVDPTLPKVVYISCLRSPQHYSGSLTASWMSIYGLTRLTPPWLLHPNELLDGAISGPTSSHSATTSWAMVNNPIVLDLYADHGRRVNFAGCIAIRTRWSEQTEKELTALQAAKLAQLLGATGAIITYDAGGNDFIEVIHTVRACERIGIKTVLLTTETPPEAEGPPLLEPLPEAVAIVSTGIGRPGLGPLALAAPARVLGGSELMATASKPWERIPSNSPLNFHRWHDHYGFGSESAFDY
jgi:glycine reductase complex component B subunit alpha and beta